MVSSWSMWCGRWRTVTGVDRQPPRDSSSPTGPRRARALNRAAFVRNACEAAVMGTSTEMRVSWGQALAWRMGRQLLDPVGSESVAGVVRRLGAVPSMDGSLAELAVRTRRTTSRPGELAKALAAGTVVKVFACRGAVHYL